MAYNNKEEQNDEQHLHSNWRALATAGFRHKTFVKSSGTEDEKDEKLFKTISSMESGESASEFYKEIIQIPSTSRDISAKKKQIRKKSNVVKIPFEKEKLFRLVMKNDVNGIKKLLNSSLDVNIDTTDMFGWTALMMAACENSVDSFVLLLNYGAKLYIQDRSGNSAKSLAEKKNHFNILNAIQEYQKSKHFNECFSENNEEEKESNGTEYCLDCKIEIPKKSSKSHQTSTVHLFSCKYNTNSKIKSFGIAHSNRGYKLMKAIGWDGNSALGAKKEGKLYPIKTVLRHKRTGLGIKQKDAKITHFKANDVRAVHHRSQPHVSNRKEIMEQIEKEKRKIKMLRRELS